MTPEPVEQELAFIPGDVYAIEKHPRLANTAPFKQLLISTYYDTENHQLGAARWSVRTRRAGDDQQKQTVKGPRVGAAVPEFEISRDPREMGLDADHLKSTPVWDIIGGNPDNLKAIFQTSVLRSVRLVQVGNSTIEVSFDDGVLRGPTGSGQRTLPINDMELELKEGEVRDLYRLILELMIDTGHMVIQPASKAERGYRYVTNSPPSTMKHQHLDLVEGTTRDTFRQIIMDAVMHLRQNLTAAKNGNMDGIHQVRVALRRMRAAIVLFQPVLRRETNAVYDDQLRYYGRVFGIARDWDVFIAQTLASAGDTSWVGMIRHAAQPLRDSAHRHVTTEIQGMKFNTLIISLMAWADHLSTAPRTGGETPFAKVAPDLLDALTTKLKHRIAKMTDAAPTIHAVRKSVKKLRYASEFVGNLYPHKKVKRFVNPCKEAQEVLGTFNDIKTVRELSETLVKRCPSIAYAIEDLLEWIEQKPIGDVAKAVKQLRLDQPFWT